MRYCLLLPLLLVGSLTGCAVYGDSYGRSGYERPYYPSYQGQRPPVYVVPPRYPSNYHDSRREDYYRQPPRFVAPPAPHYYRPPMQQGWDVRRHEYRSWGNSRDPRSYHRPPPPRHEPRRNETRGWEIRR